MKDGYQPKEHISTRPPNKGSNLLRPSEGAEGTHQLPPKLRQIEFRKVTVEVMAHYGMVYKINGFAAERDLDFGGQEFLRIYKEPKTKSEFSMIKTSSVLGIHASKKETQEPKKTMYESGIKDVGDIAKEFGVKLK